MMKFLIITLMFSFSVFAGVGDFLPAFGNGNDQLERRVLEYNKKTTTSQIIKEYYEKGRRLVQQFLSSDVYGQDEAWENIEQHKQSKKNPLGFHSEDPETMLDFEHKSKETYSVLPGEAQDGSGLSTEGPSSDGNDNNNHNNNNNNDDGNHDDGNHDEDEDENEAKKILKNEIEKCKTNTGSLSDLICVLNVIHNRVLECEDKSTDDGPYQTRQRLAKLGKEGKLEERFTSATKPVARLCFGAAYIPLFMVSEFACDYNVYPIISHKSPVGVMVKPIVDKYNYLYGLRICYGCKGMSLIAFGDGEDIDVVQLRFEDTLNHFQCSCGKKQDLNGIIAVSPADSGLECVQYGSAIHPGRPERYTEKKPYLRCIIRQNNVEVLHVWGVGENGQNLQPDKHSWIKLCFKCQKTDSSEQEAGGGASAGV